MSPLEDISWHRLVFDSNRLKRPAQRDFHTTAQERAGAPVVVTERIAQELAGLIDPHKVEESLEQAYEMICSPEACRDTLAKKGVKNAEYYVKANIWWAEEWLRPDSPYRLRTLSDPEREKTNTLLESLLEAEIFPGYNDLEEIYQLGDAVITCEAIALGRRYVITADEKRYMTALRQWGKELHEKGKTEHPDIIVIAENAYNQWGIDHKGFACETVSTAFWPNDEEANPYRVEQRLHTMLDPLRRAKLGGIAELAIVEFNQSNHWPEWVEAMRPTLPHKLRAARERHPAHPNNQRKDWTRPPEDQIETRRKYRWNIQVNRDETVLEEIDAAGKYRPYRTFPDGAERALALHLVDLDVAIDGMPNHNGNTDSYEAQNFVTTLTQAIKEERLKERARTR